jgi:hypothetical protein
LFYLQSQFERNGLGFGPADVGVSELIKIVGLLDISSRRIGDDSTLAQLVLGKISADWPDQVGKGYDNASLRTLMFAGGLFFTYAETHENIGFVSSPVGVAILADLCRSIPDREVVLEQLHLMYAGSMGGEFVVDFSPMSIVFEALSGPLQLLEAHKELLFIVKSPEGELRTG